MRGFIINLDAVVALSFVLFAMILISTQTYHPHAPGGIYLKQLTLDTLTVLEKTGRFDEAFNGNGSAIQEVLEATPHLACMSVSVYNSSGEVVIEKLKTGCTDTANLDIQVTSKPLLYLNENYIIKTEAWFRKEAD